MEEERDAYTLVPALTIIDNPDEGLRALNISMSLLSAIVKDFLIDMEVDFSNDMIDSFGIIDQTIAAINMYLERIGK
jgi:hypothetical protein